MQGPTIAAPRKPGCLGRPSTWFVRLPLGCLAFVLGGLVVLAFLFPASLGSALEPIWTQEFAAAHQGTLSFGEFRMAWFSPQRIESIMLRDPNSGYVASGELRLPPLGDCFRRLDSGVLSPIEVDLDAMLVVDDEGAFNLARALAPREGPPPPRQEGAIQFGASDGEGGLVSGVDFGFEIDRCRLSCSTPRLRSALRRELVLMLEEGQLLVSDEGEHTLAAKGRIEGGGSLELRCAFGDAGDVLAGRALPRTFDLSAADVPTELLGALLPLELSYGEALGARVAALRCTRRDAAQPIELELRTESARIDLAAGFAGGALGPAGETPASARLDFALDDFWRDEVVLRLLPVLSALAPTAEDAVARLELLELELPAGGGLSDLRANLRLELPELAFELLARRAEGSEPAPGPGLASGGPVRLSPLSLRLEAGVVVYPDVVLELPAGRAVLGGRADLARDDLALTLTLEGALARELGLPAEDGEAVVLSVTGPAAAPLVRRLKTR